MAVELKVPKVGESISEVEIGEWLKNEGDSVAVDETIVMLDSAKTTVELPAPVAGVIAKLLKRPGEVALVDEVIALIEEAGQNGASAQPSTAQSATAQTASQDTEAAVEAAPAPQWEEAAASSQPQAAMRDQNESTEMPAEAREQSFVMPAARALLMEHGLRAEEVQGSGPGGRILKEDVLRHVEGRAQSATPAADKVNKPAAGKVDKSAAGKSGLVKEGAPDPSPLDHPAPPQPDGKAVQPQEVRQPNSAAQQPQQNGKTSAPTQPAPTQSTPQPQSSSLPAQGAPAHPSSLEEVVPMTMLRRQVAARLVEAQQTAALLTTFNEIDMTAVMALRKENQDAFTKKHGVKLGFMSFFVKAAIDALKQYPAINAEIRGRDIVYKNHYDIGVAIGGGRGLVVPVLRHAERMSFADIEKGIAELAARAKDNKLAPDDLIGGTFTITNGGIYGSLMSTPIVNPPQSGILGMHATQERPVARDGQVVIRPMMYVALTYDHRIVDGREAVSFLVRVKECIENPARMLLEV